MKKLILPLLLALTTFTACSNSSTTDEIENIQMEQTEVTTEFVQTSLSGEMQQFDNYSLADAFGFVETDQAILTDSGTDGFSIKYLQDGIVGNISVVLMDTSQESYQRVADGLVSSIPEAKQGPSDILEGFNQYMYTTNTDEGFTHRVTNWKPWSDEQTLVISIYVSNDHIETVLPVGIDIVQSFTIPEV